MRIVATFQVPCWEPTAEGVKGVEGAWGVFEVTNVTHDLSSKHDEVVVHLGINWEQAAQLIEAAERLKKAMETARGQDQEA